MSGQHYYTGTGTRRKEPLELPRSAYENQKRPDGYLPDPGLVDAVNVALVLGHPLLLTGEPGTGKTLLAYSVAHELGFDDPLKFETKSTSTSKDLFYTFDTLGRFHAAHAKEESGDSLDYIDYQALGLALIRANREEDIRDCTTDDFEHGGQRRSVVLIDEIDKAPRDFPNDLLNELDEMYFRVTELGNRQISAEREFRPIVIITSNSEKQLPDAFLRRCIFYDVPFPDVERLKEIIESRLGLREQESSWLTAALKFFATLREPNSGIHKKPGTAELLDWLRAMGAKSDRNADFKAVEAVARTSLCALVKSAEDRARAEELLDRWGKPEA